MKSLFSSRLNLVGLLMSLGFGLIVFQMVRIQTVDAGKQLQERGQQYLEVSEKLRPPRGNIYDREGILLAGNKEMYEIGLDFNYVTDPETIARELSTLLEMDRNKLEQLAKMREEDPDKQYVTVKRFVSPETLQKVQETKKRINDASESTKPKRGEVLPSMRGVVWKPMIMRTYPENSIASNVLGFYTFLDPDDPHGFYGVEQQYDTLLAGPEMNVSYRVNPAELQQMPDLPQSTSLVLTIDLQIQAMLERKAQEALDANGAESVTILAMDPRTGEILGMASTPGLNLNEYWKMWKVKDEAAKDDKKKEKAAEGGTPAYQFNRAIGQTYEPGSVFKVLTMAAALDSGMVVPDTTFYDSGRLDYPGGFVTNWDGGAWGEQTMQGCMAHSLNVCLASLALDLGEKQYYEYMHAFGIGRPTQVDLAGEQSPTMRLPGDDGWTVGTLANNAFGQGVLVTPIQIASAISAVANKGKIMAPHVVKATIDGEGRVRELSPMIVSRPIKAKTARALTEMLAESVETETTAAKVEGYRFAGKTGTAEIAVPGLGYVSQLTNASFVGWGPADDPQVLVYVWIEKPTSEIWGSVVAAPVFREVTTELMKLMRIPPDDIRLGLTQK